MTHPAPERPGPQHPAPVPPAPVGACGCCAGPLGDCCKLGIGICCGCWAGGCPRCSPPGGPAGVDPAVPAILAAQLAEGENVTWATARGLFITGRIDPDGPHVAEQLAAVAAAGMRADSFGFGPRRRRRTLGEVAYLAWWGAKARWLARRAR